MLLKFTFVITYTDERVQRVTTRPATDLAFEEEFGKPIGSVSGSVPLELRDVVRGQETDEQLAAAMKWFSTSLSDRESYFLAWHAAKATDTPMVEWIETVSSIGWDLAEGVDPTPPARPAGSSLTLPPSQGSPLTNSRPVSTSSL